MIFSERPADFKPWFEVAACLCEFEGKILFLKRLEGKSEGGKWGVPGGKIDAGEDLSAALHRELMEETGIDLHDVSAQLVRTFLVRVGEKDFVYHLHRAAFSQIPKVILNPNEHVDFRWMTIDESFALSLVQDMEECLREVYQRIN